MPLVNCSKRKSNCGPLISSACVAYQGGFNDILIENNLPCNPNIEDVTDVLCDEIKTLKDDLDLSLYNKNCLVFDKNTQKAKDLFQVLTDKICVIDAILSALVIQVNGLNASNIDVTIDLGCLSSEVNNCQLSTNTYPIYTVLNLFKNEICTLKS